MTKRQFRSVAVILAFAVASISVYRAFATTYVVTGTVYDRSTGSPVSGASVRVAESIDLNGNGILDIYNATTDASGVFTVAMSSTPPADRWDAFVVRDGYAHGVEVDGWHRNLTLVPPGAAVIAGQVWLTPSTVHVTATVTVAHPTTGAPVAGAQVFSAFPQSMLLGVTDSAGQVAVRLDRTITHVLYAMSTNAAGESVEVVLGDPPYLVALQCGLPTRLFTGTVRDHAGNALAPSTFELVFRSEQTDYDVMARTVGDGSGQYEALLPDGTYSAILQFANRVLVQQVIIVPATQTQMDVSFAETLSTHNISGSILDADLGGVGGTKGVEGIEVLLERVVAEFRHGVSTSVSNIDGLYSFTGVPDGQYALSLASGNGAVIAGPELTVAGADETADIVIGSFAPDPDIAWKGSHTISGLVTDDSGLASSGATVALMPIDSGDILVTTDTDASGAYSFPSIADGAYQVAVLPFEYSSTTMACQVAGQVAVTIDGGNGAVPTIVLYRGHVFEAWIQAAPASGTGDATDLSKVNVSLNPATDPDRDPPLRQAETDTSGAIVFSQLDYDNYVLKASKQGFATTTLSVSIDQQEAVSLKHEFGWTFTHIFLEVAQ